MAQLSTAVGTTRVHTTILQEEHRVLPTTVYLFQPPATECITVPGLKHWVSLHTNTQLSILSIPPTQHVGKRGGEEHQSEEEESDRQMEEDKKYSGLRAAPLPPLHVTSNPERNKNKLSNYVIFLH